MVTIKVLVKAVVSTEGSTVRKSTSDLTNIAVGRFSFIQADILRASVPP